MKKELNINLNKYIISSIENEIDYKCNLSHTLLNFLINSCEYSHCQIDVNQCSDLSFIHNEVFNFFDVWFPKRIKIINY